MLCMQRNTQGVLSRVQTEATSIKPVSFHLRVPFTLQKVSDSPAVSHSLKIWSQISLLLNLRHISVFSSYCPEFRIFSVFKKFFGHRKDLGLSKMSDIYQWKVCHFWGAPGKFLNFPKSCVTFILDFYITQTWAICLSSSSCSWSVLLKGAISKLIKNKQNGFYWVFMVTLGKGSEYGITRECDGVCYTVGRAWTILGVPVLSCSSLQIQCQSEISEHLKLLSSCMSLKKKKKKRHRMIIKCRINFKWMRKYFKW